MPLDTLLSVLQAAEHAGVPLSTIRRGMDEGLLRFEVLRQGDREVQRIRWVDLLEHFPVATHGPDPNPGHELPSLDHGEDDPERSEPSATDLEEGQGPSDLDPPQPHEATAALTSVGASWESGLRLLRNQQEDLRNQCFELRQRLTKSEVERQRAIDALIVTQGSYLTAQSGHASTGATWWKHPAAIAAMATLVIGVAWIRGSMGSLEAAFHESQASMAQSIQDATSERIAFQASRHDAQRSAFEAKVSALEASRIEDRKSSVAESEALLSTVKSQLEIVSTSSAKEASKLREALSVQQTNFISEAERQILELAELNSASLQSIRQFESQLAEQTSLASNWQAQQNTVWEARWKDREQRAIAENQKLVQEMERLFSTNQAEHALAAERSKVELTRARQANADLGSRLATEEGQSEALKSALNTAWGSHLIPWLAKLPFRALLGS